MNAAAKNKSPLPEGFGEPEWVGDTIVADGMELRRAGVSVVSPAGETVTGSAAASGEDPAPRAQFELLERVATLDAIQSGLRRPLLTLRGDVVGEIDPEVLFPESPEPARFRYARSSGVALHQSFRSAALRARWELAERDRVLRSWRGESRPEPLPLELESCALRSSASYAWEAYHFGFAPFAAESDVVGILGFPRREGDPLAMGFAARPGTTDALRAALTEALQSLSFLWGESVPTSPPSPGPTAMHHLEYFQYPPHHAQLHRWLSGGHVRSLPALAPSNELQYVSLAPAWLPAGLSVVKAVCADAWPLTFGDVPFLPGDGIVGAAHPIA